MGGILLTGTYDLVGHQLSTKHVFAISPKTSHIGSASASLSFGHTWYEPYDVGLGIIYASEFQERQANSSQAALTCICNIEYLLRRSIEC